MPYKDPEKQREAQNKSRSKLAGIVQVRFTTNYADVYEKLCGAADICGISTAEYIRNSTIEKLIRDGYLEKE